MDNNRDKIKKDNSDEIKIQIATNGYNRPELSFIKHFNENHKCLYSLYDIEKNVMPDIIKEIFNFFSLTSLYDESYIIRDEEDEVILTEEMLMLFDKNSNNIKIDLGKKVIIFTEGSSIKFFSMSELDKELKIRVNKIYQEGIDNRKNSVHILAHTPDRGMYLTDFKIDDMFENLDIKGNYNDDFEEISDKIISNLNEMDKSGLYLLHGHHGTGKCVIGETKIQIRNKETGVIEEIDISDLM